MSLVCGISYYLSSHFPTPTGCQVAPIEGGLVTYGDYNGRLDNLCHYTEHVSHIETTKKPMSMIYSAFAIFVFQFNLQKPFPLLKSKPGRLKKHKD